MQGAGRDAELKAQRNSFVVDTGCSDGVGGDSRFGGRGLGEGSVARQRERAGDQRADGDDSWLHEDASESRRGSR